MPPIETALRYQKAVLWELVGYDGYGDPVFGDPTELDVRWEDDRKEIVGPNGRVIAVDATVVVDREIALDSRMWKGNLLDVPSPITDPMLVVANHVTPDIKNRNTRRTVMLSRMSNKSA